MGNLLKPDLICYDQIILELKFDFCVFRAFRG